MTSRNRRTPGRTSARDSSGFRKERLEHVVLEELRCILRDDARHPGLAGIALLHLGLSPDGGHARVAYSAHAEPGEQEADVARRTRAVLEAATGFLRARLAGSLDLKRLPQLGFTFVGVAPGGQQAEGGEPCPG
jgi:ribosome-binding factor A